MYDTRIEYLIILPHGCRFVNSGLPVFSCSGLIRRVFTQRFYRRAKEPGIPSKLFALINLYAQGPAAKVEQQQENSRFQRRMVFLFGVGGLCSVPVFHSLTGLPPFMGILLVLCVLWLITDIFYRQKESSTKRVTAMLSRIDMSTIMFFLGILMAVSVLAEIGVLAAVGEWLDKNVGNHYLVTGAIGILSSIVDNVPLVAGAMKMYPIAPTGDMAVDGVFWQLLAYCAGVGGSMLIIGSAAGVVAMGIEKITFGWYMKKISWVALIGYLGGILVYWLEKSVLGM